MTGVMHFSNYTSLFDPAGEQCLKKYRYWNKKTKKTSKMLVVQRLKFVKCLPCYKCVMVGNSNVKIRITNT